MDNNKEKCYLFFTNNDFTLLDYETLTFFKFFDISKKNKYTFIWKDKILYTVIQLNNFGSIFVGNYLMDPNIFIITEIDPLLLFLSVMFVTSYNNENKCANYIKKEAACTNYLEIMQRMGIEESDINETKNTFTSIINPLFSTLDLSKICDSNYNEYLKDELYRINIEKSQKYIDSKISTNENSLENKLDVTKILSFVNKDFSAIYLNNRKIDLNIQEETIMEDRRELKRVNEENKAKTIKKTKIKDKEKEKEKEIPKGQKSINSFFLKK